MSSGDARREPDQTRFDAVRTQQETVAELPDDAAHVATAPDGPIRRLSQTPEADGRGRVGRTSAVGDDRSRGTISKPPTATLLARKSIEPGGSIAPDGDGGNQEGGDVREAIDQAQQIPNHGCLSA